MIKKRTALFTGAGGIILLCLSTLTFLWWYHRPTRTNVADRTAAPDSSPNKHNPIDWQLGPYARKLKGRIVFASNVQGRFNLYTLENGHVRPLLVSAFDDSYPRWSPHGDRIAFQRKHRRQWDILVLNIKTGTISPVAITAADEENPAWSTDGRFIYYDSDRKPRNQVFAYNTKTHTTRQITRGRIARNILAEPSPDGTTLALTSNRWWGWSLVLYHPAEKRWELLVKGHSCRPAWSPNNRDIAFVYGKTRSQSSIALYRPGTKTPILLTKNQPGFFHYDPRWSPDSRFIIYQTTRDKKHGNWNIDVLDVASRKSRHLIQSPGQDVYPDWTH